MVKTTILISFCILTLSTIAQYTNNVSLNTQISTNTQNVTGLTGSKETTSNKTYTTYFDGYYKLKLQLLDENGYKTFGNNGITLDSANTSYSSASTTSIILGNNDEAIIAFWDYVNNTINLHVVSETGVVQSQTSWPSGKIPKLETLPSGDFILAYQVEDSTTIKKLSLSTGVVNELWSKTINYKCQELNALPNGNFYVTSYGPGFNFLYATTVINLIDGNSGNPIWSQWTPVSSLSNSSLYTSKVSSCTDGNNLYVSNTYFNGSGRKAHAQCIDNSGNNLWGIDGKELVTGTTFNYNTRVFSLFNVSTNELICLINGSEDNTGNLPDKIVLQKVLQNSSLGLTNAGLEITPSSYDAQLFGIEFCSSDIVYSYIARSSNNINASKIDQQGNHLWISNPIILNSTTGDKSWVGSRLNEVVGNTVKIAFEDERAGINGLYSQIINCDGNLTVGVNKNKIKTGLNIHPNPFNNQFTLNYELKNKTALLEVFDAIGKKIQTKTITKNSTAVDLKEQPNGLYFVTVTDGNSRISKKIVKQ